MGSTIASDPPPPDSHPAPSNRDRRVRAWLRERRTTALITVALLAAVLVVALSSDGARFSAPLDPDNPGPQGARAVAQVLADDGVDVAIARDADALTETLEAGARERTTVVVTSTSNLGASTIDRLLGDSSGATLVVVDAGPGVTEEFGTVRAPDREALGQGRTADCDIAGVDGLELEVDAALTYPGVNGCFTEDDASVLLFSQPVLYFGGGQALTNEQILRADNAALALRLLGQRERLVWYVPDFSDTIADDDGTSLATLIPDWVYPGLWLTALTSIVLILWRGRRLGPLATEPLPVVIKAIETTRSRGRLYRRAGDRAHAARSLRSAARLRAAKRLNLGRGVEEAALIRDLARHTDRSESQVADLVGSEAPGPTSDHDLITLANHLAELDREVRRP